jgi:KDO2-lipid IV(A) lauroyltransferase
MSKSTRKKYIREFGSFLGWMFSKGAFALIRRIPERLLITIGSGIGSLFYYLSARYRYIGLKNLTYAYGTEKSVPERKLLLKHCLVDIGKNFMEFMHAFGLSSEQIRERIELVGKEHLDKALEEKKGVIAFSAHAGNFILIGPRLIAEGYSFSVIARDPKNKRIAEMFLDMRRRFSIGSIPDKPKKECIARALRCLRDNGILFLQIDQNAAPDDPLVEFFGWHVPTFKGPVVFSLRTGSPVLPMFMIRKPDNGLMLKIDQPVTFIQSGNKDQEIIKNVTLLTKITENHIRQYPEQWWWLHRRWKKAKKIPLENGTSESTVAAYSTISHVEKDVESIS